MVWLAADCVSGFPLAKAASIGDLGLPSPSPLSIAAGRILTSSTSIVPQESCSTLKLPCAVAKLCSCSGCRDVPGAVDGLLKGGVGAPTHSQTPQAGHVPWLQYFKKILEEMHDLSPEP